MPEELSSYNYAIFFLKYISKGYTQLNLLIAMKFEVKLFNNFIYSNTIALCYSLNIPLYLIEPPLVHYICGGIFHCLCLLTDMIHGHFIFQMQLIDKREAANSSSYYNLKIVARWYRFSSNTEDYAPTSSLN